MTNRERLLAIMAGRPPDRIPWIPRLLLWYNAHRLGDTLPVRYRGWPLRDIERDLRLGAPARDGYIWKSQLDGVEIVRRPLSDLEVLTEYRTPAGTVSTVFRGSDTLRQAGIQDLQVEFLLKRREDYAAVEYLIEHTKLTPAFDDYARYDAEVGDDGYPMVNCGDCPFHYWMRALVGYNDAYFHLQDYPNEVERLLTLLAERDRSVVWPLIADSPARLILHGVHFSSQMTPPRIFDRYITGYYQELSALLAARGKTLVMHGDNDTRSILGHLERAGFRMIECFVTHPMVPTTLAEARAAWGSRMIIWGGIPSSILEDPYTDDEFESFVHDVFATIAPGDAFILGVADNVMPGAKLERVERITELVETLGTYPVGL